MMLIAHVLNGLYVLKWPWQQDFAHCWSHELLSASCQLLVRNSPNSAGSHPSSFFSRNPDFIRMGKSRSRKQWEPPSLSPEVR